jgi:nucleotide-binding universal stress UspA family protein
MAVLTAIPRVAVQNIVLITDFSPASELALSYAASIARHFGSRIQLVHALHSPSHDGAESVESTAESEATAKAKIHAEAESCADVECVEWLLKGTPLEVVERILSMDKADLVVFGAHGAHGFRKAGIGAAAEHFFRYVHSPVLAVGPSVRPCRPLWAPKHLLLATDLQSKESAAARCAVFLAREHNARLALLHVASPGVAPYPEDQEIIARPYFQSRLREILSYRSLLEYPAEFRVEFGTDASAEIVRVAAEQQTDLIVLSVHHQEPMGFHFVHEAYRIVAEAPCPVLITQRSD